MRTVFPAAPPVGVRRNKRAGGYARGRHTPPFLEPHGCQELAERVRSGALPLGQAPSPLQAAQLPQRLLRVRPEPRQVTVPALGGPQRQPPEGFPQGPARFPLLLVPVAQPAHPLETRVFVSSPRGRFSFFCDRLPRPCEGCYASGGLPGSARSALSRCAMPARGRNTSARYYARMPLGPIGPGPCVLPRTSILGGWVNRGKRRTEAA